MKPVERGKAVWRLGDVLEAHADQLAELKSLDKGKLCTTRASSICHSVPSCCAIDGSGALPPRANTSMPLWPRRQPGRRGAQERQVLERTEPSAASAPACSAASEVAGQSSCALQLQQSAGHHQPVAAPLDRQVVAGNGEAGEELVDQRQDGELVEVERAAGVGPHAGDERAAD